MGRNVTPQQRTHGTLIQYTLSLYYRLNVQTYVELSSLFENLHGNTTHKILYSLCICHFVIWNVANLDIILLLGDFIR